MTAEEIHANVLEAYGLIHDVLDEPGLDPARAHWGPAMHLARASDGMAEAFFLMTGTKIGVALAWDNVDGHA